MGVSRSQIWSLDFFNLLLVIGVVGVWHSLCLYSSSSSHTFHHLSHVHATGHSRHAASSPTKCIHHRWVEVAPDLWRLVFLILVDPLVPVNRDLMILCLVLRQAWPVLSFFVSFGESEDDVATSRVPLAFRLHYRSEGLQVECIICLVRLRTVMATKKQSA